MSSESKCFHIDKFAVEVSVQNFQNAKRKLWYKAVQSQSFDSKVLETSTRIDPLPRHFFRTSRRDISVPPEVDTDLLSEKISLEKKLFPMSNKEGFEIFETPAFTDAGI